MSEFKRIINQFKRIINNNETFNDFNIFHLIGLEKDETRLHSRFIAALLDPNGSHGKGDSFLRLFIENYFSSTIDFNYENVQIDTEITLGPKEIDSDIPTGGRLDLLISDGKYDIAIENKIRASDQIKQLLRYHNSLSNSNKKLILIYLTPTGKAPGSQSCGSLKRIDIKQYKNEKNCFYLMSYKKDIKNWLTQIINKSFSSDSENSRVKDSIIQYREIVDSIVRRNVMFDFIKDKIKENDLDENIKDLKAIYFIENEAKEIKRMYQENIINNILQEAGLIDYKLERKNNAIYECAEKSNDSIKIMLKFNQNQLFYGISGDEDEYEKIKNKIPSGFDTEPKNSSFKCKTLNPIDFRNDLNFDRTKLKSELNEFKKLIISIGN